MSQATLNCISPPKHDIHNFRDIKPRLRWDNWTSWKQELLATARDRRLYGIIIGTDLIPRETSPSASTTDDMVYIRTIPLTHLIKEWNDKNNSAYNQFYCASPQNSRRWLMTPTKPKPPGTSSLRNTNPQTQVKSGLFAPDMRITTWLKDSRSSC